MDSCLIKLQLKKTKQMSYKYLILLLVCILPFWGQAQPGFIKPYDDSIPDKSIFEDMLVDNDTLVLYSEAWNSFGVQGKRFYRIDSLGNILNQMSYYTDTTGWLLSSYGRKKIIATVDGGYAITGGVSGSTGRPYILKVKHDLTLDMLGIYPSVNKASGTSLVQLPDEGYMILCWNVDTPNNTQHPLIIRIDKNGQEFWRKTYPEPSLLKASIDIKKIDDNTYLVFSMRAEIPPFPDHSTWANAYLFTIDSLGAVKWDWEAKPSDNIAMAWDCDLLSDGSMVCVGRTWEEYAIISPGSYTSRPQIYRIDPDGNVVWQHIHSFLTGFQEFRQMVKTPDGNYLATGYLPIPGQVPTKKAMHFKFTPDGDSLWMRLDSVYETNLNWYDRITGTGLLSSGSIVSIGTAYKSGARYGFMMKLSPNGCIDTLNCWPVATEPEIISEQSLSVFPNPAYDFVTLSMTGVFRNGAEIQLVDVLGQAVGAVFPQGEKVQVDVSDWAAGIYFYRYLVDGTVLDVGRIVVEK